MKIRAGHVSNSSSSSFVLNFNTLISSSEQLATLLGYSYEEDSSFFDNIFRNMTLFIEDIDIYEFYDNIEEYCDILNVDPGYAFMKNSCEQLFQEFIAKNGLAYKVHCSDDYGTREESVMWAITRKINDDKKVRGISER